MNPRALFLFVGLGLVSFLILLPLLTSCAPPVLAHPTHSTFAPEATPATPWVRTNPGGGGWFITAKAGPDGLILAASDLSGFYRSQDRGRTWDVIGAAQGLRTTHASAIGFHPTDANILLLGTEEGIYRSENKGASVERVLDDGYITDLRLSPAQPAIGYAAWHRAWNVAEGEVYRTLDGGRTWARVSRNLPAGLRILKLILDPHDANTLYLLSGEGLFASGPKVAYRSTDGGVHWTRIAARLGDIMDVAISPDVSGRVYLTTFDPDPDGPGAFYRSDDNGASWTRLAAHGGRIWLMPGQPNRIRLIDPFHQFPWDDRNGVWESTDGGTSWAQISRVEDWDRGWSEAYWAYTTDIRALGDDLSDPEWLHWATSQFVFATDDSGHLFFNQFTDETAPGRWRSHGVDNVVMFDLTISEIEPQHLYLGYFDLGCWHSPDSGRSWRNCNDPHATGEWEGNGGNVTTLLADPARAGVVWTAQAPSWDEPGVLLRSEDYGETWTPASGLPAAPLTGLSLNPSDLPSRRTLFITAQGDVYRSQDDGRAWRKVFDCDGCRFTAVDAHNDRLIYAGGEAGLWRSEQKGAPGSWQEVGLPEMRGEVRGQIWEYGWEGVFAITPDPHASGRVYVAAFGAGKGLYRSDDRGNTWTKLWADDFMRDVAVSPQDPRILMAASSSAFMAGGYAPNTHGVLRSLDGGRTWTPQNQGMAWPFALTVAFDPARPERVWAGSPGTGFQYRIFSSPAPSLVYLPFLEH